MRHLLQSHRCNSGVDKRQCPFHSKKTEIGVLDASLSRTCHVLEQVTRCLQDGLLQSSFDTWNLCNHASFRGAKKTVVDWQRHAESFGGTI